MAAQTVSLPGPQANVALLPPPSLSSSSPPLPILLHLPSPSLCPSPPHPPPLPSPSLCPSPARSPWSAGRRLTAADSARGGAPGGPGVTSETRRSWHYLRWLVTKLVSRSRCQPGAVAGPVSVLCLERRHRRHRLHRRSCRRHASAGQLRGLFVRGGLWDCHG